MSTTDQSKAAVRPGPTDADEAGPGRIAIHRGRQARSRELSDNISRKAERSIADLV
jgi:hypothetical protein